MQKSDFEESYFKGYYKGMVGDFTLTDIKKARRWFWGWFKALEKDIDLKNGRDRKVLEIGCSIGGAASILKERGFKVYASDISSYAVKRAKKLSPDITFFIWDVEKKNPLKNIKFNLVYGFEVIEHLNHPIKALENIKEVLKPKGKFVFSTPFPYSYVYTDPTHINVKSPEEWLKIFKEVGFKKIKTRKVSFMPLLYRLSKYFHLILPFSINSRYINSTLFIMGEK